MNQQRQLQSSATQPDVTDLLSGHEPLSHDEPNVASEQYGRRFKGTQTLYGEEAVDTFAAAHIYIIGVGGVGSWAAEALARTAVGTITLIDLDVLVASKCQSTTACFGQYFWAKQNCGDGDPYP